MHACEPLAGAMVGRKTIYDRGCTYGEHDDQTHNEGETDHFMYDYLTHDD